MTSYNIANDEILAQNVYEALLYVCSMCVPSELIKDGIAENYIEVLRHIEGGKYIKAPEYPDFSDTQKHLQIDEALTYAVIYYSCFLVGKMENQMLKQMCDEITGIYNANYSRVVYEQ
jgi:hypothetical protein